MHRECTTAWMPPGCVALTECACRVDQYVDCKSNLHVSTRWLSSVRLTMHVLYCTPALLSLKPSHTGLREPIICSLPSSHACPNLFLDRTMTSSDKYVQSIIQQIEKRRCDYTHWLKIHWLFKNKGEN